MGRQIWFEESKSVAPLILTIPLSGLRDPAINSRMVDFPAPDAPNSIVMPEGTVISTSRTKSALSLVVARNESAALSPAAGLGCAISKTTPTTLCD